MSFGFSPNDVIGLITLTSRTYKGWRDACSDYADITGTLDCLYLLLRRLETHVPTQAPSELDFAQKVALRRDLGTVIRGVRSTVDNLDKLLDKYPSLSRSKSKNWERIQWGSKDLNGLRSRLTQHVSSISAFLNVVELESIGRLGQDVNAMPEIISQRVTIALGNFIDVRQADNRSIRDGTVMTSYSNDDVDVWRQFRSECVKSGIKSDDIKKYEPDLKRFFQSITNERQTAAAKSKSIERNKDEAKSAREFRKAANLFAQNDDGPAERANTKDATSTAKDYYDSYSDEERFQSRRALIGKRQRDRDGNDVERHVEETGYYSSRSTPIKSKMVRDEDSRDPPVIGEIWPQHPVRLRKGAPQATIVTKKGTTLPLSIGEEGASQPTIITEGGAPQPLIVTEEQADERLGSRRRTRQQYGQKTREENDANGGGRNIPLEGSKLPPSPFRRSRTVEPVLQADAPTDRGGKVEAEESGRSLHGGAKRSINVPASPVASNEGSVEMADDTGGLPVTIPSSERNHQAYVESTEDGEEDLVTTEACRRAQSSLVSSEQGGHNAAQQLSQPAQKHPAERSQEQTQEADRLASGDDGNEASFVDGSSNSLNDLRMTLPFRSINKADNNSLKDLESTLPVASRPTEVKIQPISNWKIPPVPPQCPLPQVYVSGTVAASDEWSPYVHTFNDYIKAFEAWDAAFLQHVAERNSLIVINSTCSEFHARVLTSDRNRKSLQNRRLRADLISVCITSR